MRRASANPEGSQTLWRRRRRLIPTSYIVGETCLQAQAGLRDLVLRLSTPEQLLHLQRVSRSGGACWRFRSRRVVTGQHDDGDKQHDHAGISSSSKSVGVVEAEGGMDAEGLSTLREDGDHQGRQSATLPRSAGTRTYRKSILRQSFATPPGHGQEAGSSVQQQNNVNATPPSRKSSMRHPARHSSEPALPSVLETPANNKGKRKAEEIDLTPPDQKHHHATFVIPSDHRLDSASISSLNFGSTVP